MGQSKRPKKPFCSAKTHSVDEAFLTPERSNRRHAGEHLAEALVDEGSLDAVDPLDLARRSSVEGRCAAVQKDWGGKGCEG